MNTKKALLMAALPALCFVGCSGKSSPTAPGAFVDTFSLRTTMVNTSGSATIVNVDVFIDGAFAAFSCPGTYIDTLYASDGSVLGYTCSAPGVATVAVNAAGQVTTGSHTLRFQMTQATDPSPATYTVMAFTLTVHDAAGRLVKTLNLPAQTASLAIGQDISYVIDI